MLKNLFFTITLFFTIVLSTIGPGFDLIAQDSLTILRERLDGTAGKDRLVLLNQIAGQYLEEGNARRALRYARDARALADNIITTENMLISDQDLYLRPQAYLNLGIAHLLRGHYMESREALTVALNEAKRLSLPDIAHQAQWNLDAISEQASDTARSGIGGFKDAFKNLGDGFNKTTAEMGVNTNIKLAEQYEKNQNYPRAIEFYDKAIAQLRNLGDWARVYELEEHIAGLLEMDGQYELALEAFDDLEARIGETNDTTGVRRVEEKKEAVKEKMKVGPAGQGRRPKGTDPSLMDGDIAIMTTQENAENMRQKAVAAEASQDYKQSLDYFKAYLELEKQLDAQKRDQELLLLDKANEIENRDREITLLRQNEEIASLRFDRTSNALDRERTFKQNLVIGLFLAAALAFALYLLYRNKRRDHRKLGLAYHDLEVTKDHLKEAEERIKGLLHEQVSGAVADELLATEDTQKVERRFVCIMFLDIRDFTPFAEKKKPEEIIAYQNSVFGFMIDAVNQHKGIVNQILGDGFMATFGAPVSSENDCLQAYLAAREIISEVERRSDAGEIPVTRVGIGLHAGHVVTGNVGTKNRKQYSVTGNTVILAARLEQMNKDFGSSLVISREVHDRLPEDIREPATFKTIQVKGRTKPMEVAAF